jgi:glycosyltransferase involved in cell wall biosynthesis
VWVNQYAVPPSEPGGTRHYELAAALLERGWDAELVVSDLSLVSRTYARRRGARDLRAIRVVEGGVAFRFLWASPYRQNDWRRLLSMVTFGTAVTVDLVARPSLRRSVLVGSSPHLFAALGTWIASVVRRRPFVFEVRDLWPETYVAISGGVSTSPQVRLLQWVADLLYRRSSAIIVLAEANAKAIAERGADPSKIVFVPNGVDLATFAPMPRAPRDIDAPIRFVYAGAHGPANGLDVVVDACAALRGRGVRGIEVVLVGDGPVKSELVARAAARGLANLTFRDPVPKAEVPALLASMDAGLMVLANTELFTYGVSPNKLFDYLAADLPVVTNVPGVVADVVLEAGAGLACPPGDPGALADAMATMASAIRRGDVTEGSGRRYVAAHFDRAVLAERVDRLLAGLLDAAPR